MHAGLCCFHAAFWQAGAQYLARLQPAQALTSSRASLTPAMFLHLEVDFNVINACSQCYLWFERVQNCCAIEELHG